MNFPRGAENLQGILKIKPLFLKEESSPKFSSCTSVPVERRNIYYKMTSVTVNDVCSMTATGPLFYEGCFIRFRH